MLTCTRRAVTRSAAVNRAVSCSAPWRVRQASVWSEMYRGMALLAKSRWADQSIQGKEVLQYRKTGRPPKGRTFSSHVHPLSWTGFRACQDRVRRSTTESDRLKPVLLSQDRSVEARYPQGTFAGVAVSNILGRSSNLSFSERIAISRVGTV